MVDILREAYGAYQHYSTDYSHHRLWHIVKDLDKKARDPALSESKRAEIVQMRQRLDTAGKEQAKFVDMALVGLAVVDFAAGKLGGPIGTAAGIAVMGSTKGYFESRRGQVIKPAERIGGVRRARRKRRGRGHPVGPTESHIQVTNASLIAGGSAGVSSYLEDSFMASVVSPLTTRAWSNLTAMIAGCLG